MSKTLLVLNTNADGPQKTIRLISFAGSKKNSPITPRNGEYDGRRIQITIDNEYIAIDRNQAISLVKTLVDHFDIKHDHSIIHTDYIT